MPAVESPHPAARILPFAAVLAVATLALVLAATDAATRRATDRRQRGAARVAARVVGPELALHAASRWLRHPTRSEPWAPFSDGPALLDTDPAGAVAPPPRAHFGAWGTVLRKRAR